MSGRGEGAGGTGRFPRCELLGARADLRGARAEACLREGGPRGKQGFPRASEPQASEAAGGFIRISALETDLLAAREKRDALVG